MKPKIRGNTLSKREQVPEECKDIHRIVMRNTTILGAILRKMMVIRLEVTHSVGRKTMRI